MAASKSRMRRRLLSVTGLCIAGLLLCVVFVVTTAPGARLAAALGRSVLPDDAQLTYENLRGSIASGLHAATLRYTSSALSVVATNARVEVHWRCLRERRICVDALEADELALALPEAEEDRDGEPWAPPAAPVALMPANLLLQVNTLELAKVSVSVGEAAYALTALSLDGLRVDAQSASFTNLAGTFADVAAQLRGNLQRDGAWNIDADIVLPEDPAERYAQHWPEALSRDIPLRYAIALDGTLDTLTATLRSAQPASIAMTLAASAQDAAQGFTLEGDLEGLPVLVPQISQSPWTQLTGPLQYSAVLGSNAYAIRVQQAADNYAQASTPLVVDLSASVPAVADGAGAVWRLDTLRLGSESAPLVQASGPLGELATLRPDLQISLKAFNPPLNAGVPVADVSGEVSVVFSAQAPLEDWRVNLKDLRFVQTDSGAEVDEGAPAALQAEGSWHIDADLQASKTLLLPRGTLGARRGDLALEYARDSNDSAPARLALPQGLALGELRLDKVMLAATPAAGDGGGQVSLDVDGDVAAALNLDLRRSAEGVEFTLAAFEATALDQPVSSAAPIEGRWSAAARQIHLEAFCLALRRNRLCSEPATVGSSGSLDLELMLDESYADTIADSPFRFKARADGTLTVSWQDAALVAAMLDLRSDYLEFAPGPDSDAPSLLIDSARLSGRFDGKEKAATLALDLDSPGGGAVSLDIEERNDALQGALNADALVLSAFNKFVPDVILEAGTVDAALTITGSRRDPQVQGEIDVGDGVFLLRDIDTRISAVNLALEARGDAATLIGDAQLGGGPLTLRGECCDADALTIDIQGRRNRLRLPVGVDALFSPDLRVALTREALALSGTVRVHDGVLEHSAPAPGGVPFSEDVVRVDLDTDRQKGVSLQADLRTLIEPGFTVRSKEIEATVGGDLRLALRPDRPPALFGNLQVLGGELRAYGQALRLTEGAVGFIGDPLNPDLSLNAEREIRAEQLRVGFRVRGNLDAPSLELFSDPPRPERETLSYLLRGRGPDAGAAMDGTAMALSLGASAINQSGALNSLNAIPGLSEVTIGAEGSDDAMAATISAYVGERLYLSYGVGIYEPVNALTARLYLRSRLWLEVVSRLESSFDLYYRFDRE